MNARITARRVSLMLGPSPIIKAALTARMKPIPEPSPLDDIEAFRAEHEAPRREAMEKMARAELADLLSARRDGEDGAR
jgi:hypothetical protein